MPRLLSLLYPACLISLATNLSGCATSADAIWQTAKTLVIEDAQSEKAHLDPRYRYLKVTTAERSALLVLGYIENHPAGEIEVWYSATGEVIQIQNGRLIGTAGLATNWTAVRLEPSVPWTAFSATPIKIKRFHDEMPGYRMNIEDTLWVRTISAPSDSSLNGIDPASLSWIEERQEIRGKESSYPPARYGISRSGQKVIYGEQCLKNDLCLSWQRWPTTVDMPL